MSDEPQVHSTEESGIEKPSDVLLDVVGRAECLIAENRHGEALQLLDKTLATTPGELSADDIRARVATLRAGILQRRRLVLHRLYLAAIATVAIAIVGGLHFTPMDSVEISAEITAGGFFAKVENDGYLSIDGLDSIILSGAYGISVHADEALVSVMSADAETRVPLKEFSPTVIRPAQTVGNIRIEGEDLELSDFRLYASKPLEITLGAGQDPTLTISHDADASSAVIRTGETVSFSCAVCRLVQDDEVRADEIAAGVLDPMPQELILDNIAGSTDVNLHFTPTANDETRGFFDTIAVSEIDFTTQRSGQVVSMIREGVVTITEIDGRSVTLGSAEFLDMRDLRDLKLTELHVGESLRVRLRGNVGELQSGFGVSLHSRIPSRLEWLLANESLNLFAGVLSAVFGFILAVLVKLKLIDKG